MDEIKKWASKEFAVPPERLEMEEQLLSAPLSPQRWIILAKTATPPPPPPQQQSLKDIEIYLKEVYSSAIIIWERSLSVFPSSFKLWMAYITERVSFLNILLGIFREDQSSPSSFSALLSEEIAEVEEIYERALNNKEGNFKRMPMLWISYISFSIRLRRIRKTRHLFNLALKTLPFSLHSQLWTLIIGSFAEPLIPFAPKVSHHFYRRFHLHFAVAYSGSKNTTTPTNAYSYFNILKRLNEFDEAFDVLINHIKDWYAIPSFIDNYGSLLKERIDEKVAEIDSNDKGVLICAVANWHLKNGRLKEGRAVLRKALSGADRMRDFVVVFECLAALEEGLIRIAIDNNNSNTKRRIALLSKLLDSFERLLKIERPSLISDLLLRKSPNSISVWMERIERLCAAGAGGGVNSEYRKCLSTIDPMTKGISKIWISFAKAMKSPKEKEEILLEALKQQNILKEEMALLWIALSQHRGEVNGIQDSIGVVSDALLTVGLEKNALLWDCYLDLEEARGLPLCVESAYERIISIGACRPQHIVNYFLFLDSLSLDALGTLDGLDGLGILGFKNTTTTTMTTTNKTTINNINNLKFRVLELGIQKFKSVSVEFWKIYLPKFISSPQATLKSVRDLYERALVDCVGNRSIYEIALSYENKKRNYSVYLNLLKEAARSCEEGKFSLYWRLVDHIIDGKGGGGGVSEVRQVMDEALPSLEDPDELIKLSLRYASLECSLGELERTRSIYRWLVKEIITISPPFYKRDAEVWLKWQDFETKFGTEISFRELLRYKRSLKEEEGRCSKVQFVSPTAESTTSSSTTAAFSSSQIPPLQPTTKDEVEDS